MVCKEFFVEGIDSSIDGSGLDEDVVTVSVVLEHSDDSADLAFDALEAVNEFFAIGVRAVGVLGAAGARGACRRIWCGNGCIVGHVFGSFRIWKC